MLLSRSIPLLFGTPTARGSRRAIAATALIMGLGISGYLVADMWERFPFFPLFAVLIAAHGVIAFTTSGANLLFIFRYFLIWILILATACMWALYGGEVLLAPFGLAYQTAENTRILVFAGFLSLCGAILGWHLALAGFSERKQALFSLPPRLRTKLRNAGLVLALGFGLLYVYKAGGVIGGGTTYAANVRELGFEFGVFNVFHFTGIALLLVAGVTQHGVRSGLVWVGIGTLALGVLTGSRADFLPQMLILFALLANQRVRLALANRDHWQLAKLLGLAVLLALAGYILALMLSIWRFGIDPRFVIDEIRNSGRGSIINELYGHRMLYLETGNMMLGGFYSAIVQVREGITGYLLGQSYLDYLAIAPPAFLGLPRPPGLEWLTDVNGLVMSQGGIFEPAEAYWNFGFAGCLIVSFLISYVFGWLLRQGLQLNSYFFLVWYTVFGLHAFRAVWYQNFSYFRVVTVMLVIYVMAAMVFKWYIGARAVARSVHTAGISTVGNASGRT